MSIKNNIANIIRVNSLINFLFYSLRLIVLILVKKFYNSYMEENDG